MNNNAMYSMSELSKKFRSIEDRENFCTELNLWWPHLPGFDMAFFLLVLQQRKKLLPLGMSQGFTFKYFTKKKKFTKEHLYSYFQQSQDLMRYLPDNLSMNSINRSYLLSVIAYENKDLWKQLFGEYKQILSNASTQRWTQYGISLHQDVIAKLNEFVSVNAPGHHKQLRVSKKGVPIDSIQPLNSNNLNFNVGAVGGNQVSGNQNLNSQGVGNLFASSNNNEGGNNIFNMNSNAESSNYIGNSTVPRPVFDVQHLSYGSRTQTKTRQERNDEMDIGSE